MSGIRQICIFIVAAWATAAAAAGDDLFEKRIRPILFEHCLSCHSTEKQKGELDLERYSSESSVLKEPGPWELVIEQLELGEMPPKEKPPLTGEARETLLTWIRGALDAAAEARAGDPGPVVLRRLNNAEYTYTIRDLTGVDSLDPAREFPADSSAGEGFMNTGNSLVMSPALLAKYLDAAKEIASHAVLLPDGFRFSSKNTRRDWTDETVARIRTFYRRYTDSSGANKVNLQGIIFDTNEGGRLPVEKYLRALREGTPASQAGLSTKYLDALRILFEGTDESFLIGQLRGLWRNGVAPAELTGEIELWQNALWKFSSVGQFGKTGGPKAWMEPLDPFTSTNPAIRLKLSAATNTFSREQIEHGLETFRQWFPPALCYVKIVPVDEVVTLTLFYREDHHLSRLILNEEETAELDRIWAELRYISQDAITLVDVFEQLWQYATQDADPQVFEPMRQPINEAATAFRRELAASEPRQVDALLEFANRVYRRPLTSEERYQLQAFYRDLRAKEMKHEEAFRLTLARLFVAPAFLYRLEKAAPGSEPAPVSNYELATRLSYFLWSSTPDGELFEAAGNGKLREPDELGAQTRRMLRDPRVRRLATEFACAWLHIHGFDSHDEKSERHFPGFAQLRGPMYEEAIQFFADLFSRDLSVLKIFDADHTFLNGELAAHYGVPGVTGPDWRRVEGVQKYSRGGVLGLGATLAKQSGASRTSPILRGAWVAEALLGEKLPRPPKDVPRLPEDEAVESLSVRELVERHSNDPRCAGCHARIDPYGFALEGFDAIGRARTTDLAGRPVRVVSTMPGDTVVNGFEGLRSYLATEKRDVLLRQFCRKLLGYSLGRAVLLSDNPLLAEMMRNLAASEYRFSAAVETIIRSRQFREIRGVAVANEG